MSDDQALKQAVLDELIWEPSVNAAHIGVTAKDGVITLMGHVGNFFEKSAAERAARRVNDVKAVAEQIEVRLPFNVSHGDEDIASAALNRLKWDSTIPSGAIKPKVEKGWVTLTGEVDWHFQQEAAVSDIRGLRGVVGVSDEITIKPKPNTSTIRDNIMVALDRSWFDPAAINVTAEGGRIRLTGTVNSWYERNEAGDAAWAAPGTTSVENDISVR
jgi:osmotically-inducible protein OsmY